jgi:hypothetical protein
MPTVRYPPSGAGAAWRAAAARHASHKRPLANYWPDQRLESGGLEVTVSQPAVQEAAMSVSAQYNTPSRVAATDEGIGLDELALAARNHAMPLEALRYEADPVTCVGRLLDDPTFYV